MRSVGGAANLDRLNEQLPGNLAHKLRSKLGKAAKAKAEKTLEERIEADAQALAHQKYLIDGVMNSLSSKKLNYHTASKGLLKTNTERWLKKHDSASENAIGLTRGAYFGAKKQSKLFTSGATLG